MAKYLLLLTLLLCCASTFAAGDTGNATGSSVQLKELVANPAAIEYSRWQYTRPIADALFAIIVYGIILQSGVASRLQDSIRAKFKNRLVQVFLYYASVSGMAFFGCLPYYYFYSHWLPVHFDLSRLSELQWIIERSKRFLVNVTIGGIYWSLFFLLVDKFKKSWHLVLFAVLAPLSAFMVFLWPLVVDPLFNNFADLPAGSLRTNIETLAKQAGIPDASILVVDKSTQTKELNAYVTGIGPSARIVLWDTILQGMPENELLTVVGHETGHYVLMHVYKGYALCMVALLVGLMAAGTWAPLIISKLPARWGLRALSDLTIIPVIVLCTAPSVVLFSPIESSISRMFEHESDVFALNLTKDPISLANAFITLAKKDLVDPHPPAWIEFWFFSHPSLGKRIEFALSALPSKAEPDSKVK
jgi:STE24 endopeptidase